MDGGSNTRIWEDQKKWLLVWNKDTEQRFQVLVLSPTFLGEIFTPFFGHLRVFRPGAREPRQPLRNLPTTKYLAISKIAQSSTAPTVHDAQLRVKPELQTPDIRELAAHTNQIPGPTADPATPASPAPGLGIATFGPKGKERRCKCSIDSPVHVWRRGR